MRFFTMFVLAALAAFLPVQAQAGSYISLHRGIVVSAADPLSAHRLRVRVPDVLGNAAVWAQPSVPYAPDPAKIAVPPAGSTVWILFERGDIDHPVWIGWLPGSAPLPAPH